MLVYLIAFSKIEVSKEAKRIEQSLTKQLERFDLAYKAVQEEIPTFKAYEEVQFLVYDQRGKLISWTDNTNIPSLEQFLLSPTTPLLSSQRGEYLFKTYDLIQADQAYKVIAFVPIRQIFESDLRAFPDLYNRDLIPDNLEIGRGSDAVEVRLEEKTLFGVRWSGESNFSESDNQRILLILTTLFFGLYVFIYYMAVWVRSLRGLGLGVLFLVVAFVLLRGGMVWSEFPTTYFRLGIFASATFRFEWFYSSLGDAILNVVALNLFLVYLLSQKKYLKKRSHLLESKSLFYLLILLGYFAFYLFADTIQILLAHSQLSLDITETLDFPLERIAAYALLALLAILYFLITYLGFEVFRASAAGKKEFFITHLIGMILSGLILNTYANVWLVIGSNFFYHVVALYFDLPANLQKLKFDSLNYLILTAVLLALSGSILIFKSFEKKETNRIRKFATYLQLDRDIDAEYLLSNIANQIKNDVVVNSKMLNPQSQRTSIVERIKRTYFNTYFNNYEIEIALFDENGQAISEKHHGLTYSQLKEKYASADFATSDEHIFYDSRMDIRKRKKFVCFVTLERYQNVNGYLEIELRLKKFSGKRVLPQLLVSPGQHASDEFDHGIYLAEHLIYKSGDYDYESREMIERLNAPALYDSGIEVNDYFHLAVKSGDKTIVISSPVYQTGNMVSNFSFLFTLLMIVASMILLFNYLLLSSKKVQMNFSTKILLYSGSSFIIPLLLVGIAVMTSTDVSNRNEIDKSNLKKTMVMTEDVNDHLGPFYRRAINKEELENEISQLASHAGMDLNLYSKEGRLLASSTPMIFESNVISKYLVAQAMDHLILKKRESLILDEAIGDFQYKTSYVSILSPETGEFLGVLGAPYFASKNHLQRQQLQVFGSIINIFTFVFILSILIAYFIIARLTRPIVAIADRLHQTGFVEENQPIEWSADDEIGTLVSEYNNMLGKLESTKIELARNEKEAAWREMAKQVAHEIKNPLTPMKLTIQHLQRLMGKEAGEKKSLEILLSQIDTLDEIVTSFSHFAKMPTPEREPFDVRVVLEKSIDLHVDKAISKALDPGSFVILGDKKLFGRIFNNLILNAFQSMRGLEAPRLEVFLTTESEQVRIAFRDSGEGIPLDIRDKIFTPNFSTKESGSGIGLAVAKRGIEHAGGSIWFETVEGQGTTFFILLPLSS